MASLASIGELGQARYGKGFSAPTHQDSQEDYYAFEECDIEDSSPSPPDSPQHGGGMRIVQSKITSKPIVNGTKRLSNSELASEVISISPHTGPPPLTCVKGHRLSTPLEGPDPTDNDYENQEVLESQLMEEWSDEEEEGAGPRLIKAINTAGDDYMNSSQLDSELEIVGTGRNGLLHQVERAGTNSGRSREGSDSGAYNKQTTSTTSLTDSDYANQDVIDAELFKDNIRPRDANVSLSYSTSFGLSDHPLRGSGESPREAVSCDPLPPGVVQKRYAPAPKKTTPLGTESEIKLEQTGDFDPTVLNSLSLVDTQSPDGLGNSNLNLLLTERVKSSVTPLLTEPSYRGKPKQETDELSGLDTFERTLLQTGGPTTLPMPNILEIPWYHEGISRHIAESLLTAKTIKDGTYLLRDNLHSRDSVTLSVRCQHSVKHYRIVWDGKQFVFGLGKFPNLKSFKAHFENQPIISGESGILVQLKYPYPRAVEEPAIYVDPDPVNVAAGVTGNDSDLSDASASDKPVPRKWVKKDKGMKPQSHSVPELSVNSKEGYLTKQGLKVKNWKRRWFVLFRNELRYYMNQESKEPIKVIDLSEATAVERDESAGKPHCFKLITSNRTFFMYGTSETETNEWVQILDWKLNRRSRCNSRV